MSEPKVLHAGQKLFWVWSGKRGCPAEVEVLSVGRKWAQLSNRYRIDITTMWADGGKYLPPGRCYWSKDEYEQISRLNADWANLKRALQGVPLPDGLSSEDIGEVRRLLKLSTEEGDI